MMDNASALPTRAQQQQQQKLLLIIVDQKLPTRLRDEAKFRGKRGTSSLTPKMH
jgi:hypothetical protein